MFQGEPFDEEDYCNAIFAVQTAMDRYDPAVIGYCWDDSNPRIQLEPRGERGYIEMRAVRKERFAQKKKNIQKSPVSCQSSGFFAYDLLFWCNSSSANTFFLQF